MTETTEPLITKKQINGLVKLFLDMNSNFKELLYEMKLLNSKVDLLMVTAQRNMDGQVMTKSPKDVKNPKKITKDAEDDLEETMVEAFEDDDIDLYRRKR